MLETAFLFFVDNICRDAARHVPTNDKKQSYSHRNGFCSFRLGYG